MVSLAWVTSFLLAKVQIDPLRFSLKLMGDDEASIPQSVNVVPLKVKAAVLAVAVPSSTEAQYSPCSSVAPVKFTVP